MKLRIHNILAILCALILCDTLSAQPNDTLKVGDPAPELKVYNWVKGEPVLAFEKGKIYVVELGATWCKPCLKAIPELTALAKEFSHDVTVIGIFVMEYQDKEPAPGKPKYVERVEKYVEKQGDRMQYHVAVDFPDKQVEKKWIRAAQKNSIPVTFIIDRAGRIAWIGANTTTMKVMVERVSSRSYNISQAIAAAEVAAAEKTPYDPYELLLVKGNGGTPDDILFRSVLTRYEGDIKTPPPFFISNYSWAEEGTKMYECRGRVQATGASLLELYQLAYSDTLWNQISIRGSDNVYSDTKKEPYTITAYGKAWHQPLLEVKDVSPFQTTYRSRNNKFNYSLKIPLERNTALNLQEAMQRDLKTYFGYDVAVEQRLMPCWKLKATKNVQKLLATKTPGKKYQRTVKADGVIEYKNAVTRDVLSKLGTFYGFGMLNYGRLVDADVAPFIDETGITYEIDFHIDMDEVDNFETFRKTLSQYGLYLEKSKKLMKVVVVRDPAQPTSRSNTPSRPVPD